MSIEEKAKAYDEAIEKAKSWYIDAQIDFKKVLENLFPKLKKDEDESERIRNEIIDFIYDKTDTYELREKSNSWLAWLEKQGENKPVDKAEPKFNFNIGQWIVATGKCVYLIVKIDGSNVILVDTNGDEYVFDASSLDDAHLWTIQDAKDGDILTTDMYPVGMSIFIFKSYNPSIFSIYCYGFVNSDGVFMKNAIPYHRYDVTIYPATREQRNLFFQKMKEAGYEWNAEKKELKKIKKNEIFK